MSSSQDEDRQQALSHHPQQDLVPPASRPSPPGDADAEDNVGSSHPPIPALSRHCNPTEGGPSLPTTYLYPSSHSTDTIHHVYSTTYIHTYR